VLRPKGVEAVPAAPGGVNTSALPRNCEGPAPPRYEVVGKTTDGGEASAGALCTEVSASRSPGTTPSPSVTTARQSPGGRRRRRRRGDRPAVEGVCSRAFTRAGKVTAEGGGLQGPGGLHGDGRLGVNALLSSSRRRDPSSRDPVFARGSYSRGGAQSESEQGRENAKKNGESAANRHQGPHYFPNATSSRRSTSTSNARRNACRRDGPVLTRGMKHLRSSTRRRRALRRVKYGRWHRGSSPYLNKKNQGDHPTQVNFLGRRP